MPTPPVIEVGDILLHDDPGDNHNIPYQAHNIGDLVIMLTAWDDDDTVTAPTTGPNGESLTGSHRWGPGTPGGTEGPTICGVWWVATDNEAQGTLSWGVSAFEAHTALCIVVPAGEFDPDTPIDSVSTLGGSSSDVSNLATRAWTVVNANCRICCWIGIDFDAIQSSNPSGWTQLQATDEGTVHATLALRTLGSSLGESISSVNFTATAPDSYAAIGFAINAAPDSPPVITSVTPDTFTNEDTGISIAGTDFEAAQGSGKVELGDNSDYGAATLVEQTIESWSDTEIVFTAVKGALSAGTLYVFVTTDGALISDGSEVTLEEPEPEPEPGSGYPPAVGSVPLANARNWNISEEMQLSRLANRLEGMPDVSIQVSIESSLNRIFSLYPSLSFKNKDRRQVYIDLLNLLTGLNMKIYTSEEHILGIIHASLDEYDAQ